MMPSGAGQRRSSSPASPVARAAVPEPEPAAARARAVIRGCGWRCYAAKLLNAVGYTRDGLPYSPSMTIKVFATIDLGARDLGAHDAGAAPAPGALETMLRDSMCDACPALAWQFADALYEPHLVAYDRERRLQPFDYRRRLVVEAFGEEVRDLWDFVRRECGRDETRPQVFGEALRMRYALGPDARVHLRFTFNHALVDGLMIAPFLARWEREVRRRGLTLLPVVLEGGAERVEWRTQHVAYSVEELSARTAPRLGRRGFSYAAILAEILARRRFRRVRQAVASPRHARVQLALAPVARRPGFARFAARNAALVRHAQGGNRLNALWALYARDERTGDRITRFLLGHRLLGRWLFIALGGDVVVSGFGGRHIRFLAFPVVHALQREGVAVCSVWSDAGVRKARLVRVVNLRG